MSGAAKTTQIRVDFPVAVEISRDAHFALTQAVDMICEDWEAANPGQVMWTFGFGAMPLTNPFMEDDEHPMRFADHIEHIEVAAREAFPKEEAMRARRMERRAAVGSAGPALLAFAQAILTGLEGGAIRIETEQDEVLANVLARGRQAVDDAKGGGGA